MKLSERLQWIADRVPAGAVAADVGTDHGLLPIFLLQSGRSSRVILSDVNPGPLEKARGNLEHACPDADCALRLGSGLAPLAAGEADAVIIAGMGGLLIRGILDAEPEKSRSFPLYLLQPRSAAAELRRYLFENGWEIAEEALLLENGHFCELFTARPCAGALSETERARRKAEAESAEAALRFEISPLLREAPDEIFRAWLRAKLAEEEKIRGASGAADSERGRARAAEAARRAELLRSILAAAETGRG